MTELQASREAYTVLKEMAHDRGLPVSKLLDGVFRQMRKDEIIRQGNEAYARLRQDPKAWAEELAERRLWDCALMDGLEDDPWEDSED